jgi:hypothetical protein
VECLTLLCKRTREGHILSKPSNNLEGLPEHILRSKQRAEAVPCRQYRVRRRKDVPIEEQSEIASAYLRDYLPQKDVAIRYQVSVQLVKDLVAEVKHEP